MPLTNEDLAELYHQAIQADDAEAALTRFLAAINDEGLADPDDETLALGMASELADDIGDIDQAIALARLSVAADSRPPRGAQVYPRAHLAELLLAAGQTDEGMQILTGLRPLMATEPDAGVIIAEALELTEHEDIALEWLTSAIDTALSRVMSLDDDSAEAATNAAILRALIAYRHQIRAHLELDHDDYDELHHELDQVAEPPTALVFWPESDFVRLTSEHPTLAAFWEPAWGEHRDDLESTLRGWSERGLTDIDVIVASAEEFTAFAARQGLSLDDVEEIDEAEHDFLEERTNDPASPRLAWPPRRNERCWCGSGDKYKKCCLVRVRT